ncbi:hypothetical protein FRC08_013218 [Ceratobasidium sp. 394]|nr:hypothetical protein FRC08_013218 [Ceratobasidium sp. 394]
MLGGLQPKVYVEVRATKSSQLLANIDYKEVYYLDSVAWLSRSLYLSESSATYAPFFPLFPFGKLMMEQRIMYLENPLPNIVSGCVLILPSRAWTMYIAPMIYEFTVFTLTLWRIFRLSREFGSSTLMHRVAENGILYFAVLLVLILFSGIGGGIDRIKLASNGSGILAALSSVVCSRIMFSLYALRAEDARNLSQSGDYETDADAQFAIPMTVMNGDSS